MKFWAKKNLNTKLKIKQISRSFLAILEEKAKSEYRVYSVLSLLGCFKSKSTKRNLMKFGKGRLHSNFK